MFGPQVAGDATSHNQLYPCISVSHHRFLFPRSCYCFRWVAYNPAIELASSYLRAHGPASAGDCSLDHFCRIETELSVLGLMVMWLTSWVTCFAYRDVYTGKETGISPASVDTHRPLSCN